MLVELFRILSEHYSVLNVFQYLTFRSMLSVITALMISLLLGPKIIARLLQLKVDQSIREDGPQSHLKKTGTPTMGGALILVAIAVSTLLWADLRNHYVWTALIVTLGAGLVGGIDDYLKIKHRNSAGLSGWRKIIGLTFFTVIGLAMLLHFGDNPAKTNLYLPIFKDVFFNLGWLFIPWGFLVIVGTSNAVNLTDGLDGLAIMPTILVAAGLGVIVYASGHLSFSSYLSIPYFNGLGELTVFCAAIFGAGLGFLWFNTYPAQVFMGDVGSLGLGAALGIVAMASRQEFVLMIMGGIFVIEAISVIIQVGSFKLRGKRVFRMAPIHHHFEIKGWAEPKIIVRFWIITIVLVLVGLMTLKVR